MKNSVEDAIEIIREEGGPNPVLETALRQALSEAEVDERGEVSLGELIGTFRGGNTFEVTSKRLGNVVLNWPTFVELLCKEGAGLAGRPRIIDDQHPWVYPVRVGIKALQWLVDARNIDLGPASAALVHELWIARKGEERVALTDLAASQVTLSAADVRALVESLSALGIVKIEGDQVVKGEKFVLLVS